jgi:hypothetical protein
MTTHGPKSHLEQLVASACCLVGTHPDVATITVVGERRLTYDELRCLREQAVACHVDVTMDGSGTVLVRRKHAAPRVVTGKQSRLARWRAIWETGGMG